MTKSNPAPAPFEEKILRRIPVEILLLAVLIALPFLLLWDIGAALLAAAGGIVAAISFIWLKQSITKFLLSMNGKEKAVRSALLAYGLRLILIIAIFFIIILFFSRKVLAFAAGFSSIILVFLIEAVSAFTKLKQWKE